MSGAYDQLKKDITSDQVLAHFNPKIPIVLSTDASNVAVSGVLCHSLANGLRPVAFVSRALSRAERNYSTIQKEALAVIFSVTKLRQYLLGNRFVLQTDHKPLLTIFGEHKGLPVMAAARMQRWAYILSGFNYEIRYINGSSNFADHLSRLPQTDTISEGSEYDYINFITSDNRLNLNFRDIARATKQDPVLSKLMVAIQNGTVGSLRARTMCHISVERMSCRWTTIAFCGGTG